MTENDKTPEEEWLELMGLQHPMDEERPEDKTLLELLPEKNGHVAEMVINDTVYDYSTLADIVRLFNSANFGAPINSGIWNEAQTNM